MGRGTAVPAVSSAPKEDGLPPCRDSSRGGGSGFRTTEQPRCLSFPPAVLATAFLLVCFAARPEWVHPVHEVLSWTGEGRPGPVVVADGVQLDHRPDPTKSRAQYLPLLELSVAENPEDDRNVHYLGREYLYKGRWDDCIRTLKSHLAMPRATWRDERAAFYSVNFLE